MRFRLIEDQRDVWPVRVTISFPVVSMNPLDIAQELTIGDLARAVRP